MKVHLSLALFLSQAFVDTCMAGSESFRKVVVSVDSTRASSSSSSTVESSKSSKSSPAIFVPAVKSLLSIQIPVTLHNKYGEPHRLAQFGFVRDSGSLSHFVYFVDDNLCSSHAFDYGNTTYPNTTNGLPRFFLLAKDQKLCSVVRMARNAQEIGASALLLGEPACHCDDKTCTDAYPTDASGCLDKDLPLVDDGSASDVSIPTVLLPRQTAEVLYQQLRDLNQPVMVQLTWGLPLSYDDVPQGQDLSVVFAPHYFLWTTARDPLLSAAAYRHFRTLAVAFGRAIHFNPKFVVQSGLVFGCEQSSTNKGDAPTACGHLCTNHGRYCTSQVDDLSGRSIIQETLRRLCIYQHYPAFDLSDKSTTPKNDKINTAYWDYVIHHMEHCQDTNLYGDDNCIADAYKIAKIDKTSIDMCMKDTGDIDTDESNSLLDEMMEDRLYSSVVMIPALTINGGYKHVERPYATSLFSDVCDMFWESTFHSPFENKTAFQIQIPTACDVCGPCPNVMGCLEAGRCVASDSRNFNPYGDDSDNTGAKKKRRGYGWTITFLFLGTAIAGGAYYYYKKREELGEHAYSLLDGYMHMSSRT